MSSLFAPLSLGPVRTANRVFMAPLTRMRASVLGDVPNDRAFIANPDLPRRLAEGLPLNPQRPETLYGGDESGYTDYPAYA